MRVAFIILSLTLSAHGLDKITDVKSFDKLLRTQSNVLILFTNSPLSKSNTEATKWQTVCNQAAKSSYGTAAVAHVDCLASADTKKLCKKQKISTPLEVRHYDSGSFNKMYDRQPNAESMYRFLLDPKGDPPWEEDTTSRDVRHIGSVNELQKLMQQQSSFLLMVYVPWCGHCKRLKPQYAAAATELKGTKIMMAAINVELSENAVVKNALNVTGFPTLIYFERGEPKFQYGDGHQKENLVNFMNNPAPPKPKEPEVPFEDEIQGTSVALLTSADFDAKLKQAEHALVMFYAPWCGHCKKIKPQFISAATKLEDDKSLLLAAVDATVSKDLGQKYEVSGYPTLKYFLRGEYQWDYTGERNEEGLVSFLRNPVKPAPQVDEWPSVVQLTDETFRAELKRRKHALVMFFAPWCGHCKRAKPEYEVAAKEFSGEPKILLSAVDCTSNTEICDSESIRGYPTFKYFHYLNKKSPEKYSGGYKADDFIGFMTRTATADDFLRQHGSPGVKHANDEL